MNTERELLYKILFDLRSDMSEMKRMVAELLAEKSYDAPKSDIAGLLPRGSCPSHRPLNLRLPRRFTPTPKRSWTTAQGRDDQRKSAERGNNPGFETS